ncbi:ubiquilin-3-like [Eublepharis macularius]|uniref:Ubiquilin-3-like n=1 Tax=Eublepharis macularius TaxID=481883 RepID=A0AA97J320_EUBMA|nr:ubiquilin-3-like [Eublepharis macularius]
MEILGKGPEGPVTCPVIATSPSFICITAKSPKASAQFVLPETCTIQEFKDEIAKRFQCETSQLVLVFFGRILKDQATLRQCGIGDGMTVHLVVRSQQREQEDPPQLPFVPRAPVCAQAPPHGTLRSAPFSRGSWGPPEAGLSNTEWPPVPTSEVIVQKVRQVILANPEIQQLAQQVPSIGHILNNADIMHVILDKMREIMDMARNPEMLPDLKSPDQALVSLQSNIPGGDNPLRQLNSEMPEPGLSAGQDCFVFNPYATLVRSPGLYPEQGTLGGQGPRPDSQEPLVPRPLASQSTTSICSEEGGASTHWAPPPGHCFSLPSPIGHCSETGPFGTGGSLSPDPAEIPMMIVSLCNAYTKRMMFSLMQNALLASQNAQAGQQEQIKDQVSNLSQQMQSPEMTAAMSNPTAIQAWVQMEQGLQTLLAEAPVLLPWFMLRLRGLESLAGGNQGPNGPACQSTAAAE